MHSIAVQIPMSKGESVTGRYSEMLHLRSSSNIIISDTLSQDLDMLVNFMIMLYHLVGNRQNGGMYPFYHVHYMYRYSNDRLHAHHSVKRNI